MGRLGEVERRLRARRTAAANERFIGGRPTASAVVNIKAPRKERSAEASCSAARCSDVARLMALVPRFFFRSNDFDTHRQRRTCRSRAHMACREIGNERMPSWAFKCSAANETYFNVRPNPHCGLRRRNPRQLQAFRRSSHGGQFFRPAARSRADVRERC